MKLAHFALFLSLSFLTNTYGQAATKAPLVFHYAFGNDSHVTITFNSALENYDPDTAQATWNDNIDKVVFTDAKGQQYFTLQGEISALNVNSDEGISRAENGNSQPYFKGKIQSRSGVGFALRENSNVMVVSVDYTTYLITMNGAIYPIADLRSDSILHEIALISDWDVSTHLQNGEKYTRLLPYYKNNDTGTKVVVSREKDRKFITRKGLYRVGESHLDLSELLASGRDDFSAPENTKLEIYITPSSEGLLEAPHIQNVAIPHFDNPQNFLKALKGFSTENLSRATRRDLTLEAIKALKTKDIVLDSERIFIYEFISMIKGAMALEPREKIKLARLVASDLLGTPVNEITETVFARDHEFLNSFLIGVFDSIKTTASGRSPQNEMKSLARAVILEKDFNDIFSLLVTKILNEDREYREFGIKRGDADIKIILRIAELGERYSLRAGPLENSLNEYADALAQGNQEVRAEALTTLAILNPSAIAASRALGVREMNSVTLHRLSLAYPGYPQIQALIAERLLEHMIKPSTPLNEKTKLKIKVKEIVTQYPHAICIEGLGQLEF